ncbi:MAG: insulinase family protein [Bacteroidales bacterium]|nr:insulinase family protein [Bacteroidales bacterium]
MKKIFISIVSILAMGLSLYAQNPVPNDPAVTVGKLDNGMTYYIRANQKPAGRAEFYLATHAGAIFETPDQDGLAHFLEHMCFNGTKNFPGKGILNYLQTIGAEFGRNVNASTGLEQTIYMLNNIPVNKPNVVDSCLLIMHDYSHFVTCDPKEIDAERGVIIEEKRTRNNAQWRSMLKSFPVIFGPNNPFASHSIIGSQEQLETFKPESLTNFYHTWYVPQNQALIVVGDVNVAEVEAKIKATFADIPAVENPTPRPYIIFDPCDTPRVGIITDPEQSRSSVEVYFMAPVIKDFKGTDVGFLYDYVKLCSTLIMQERFKEISSRLNSPFLSASAGATEVSENTDAFYAQAQFKDGEGVKAFRALLLEIEKLQRFGFTADELDRANSNLLSYLEMLATGASTRENSDYIEEYVKHFFTGESFPTPEVTLKLAQSFSAIISPEIVKNMLSNYFSGKNIAVIYSAPEKEGLVHPKEKEILDIFDEVKTAEIAVAASASIDTDLLAGKGKSLKGSKVAKTAKAPYGFTLWTLKNGVKVYVLPTEFKKDEVLIYTRQNGGESLIATEDLPSFEDNIWSVTRSQAGISTFDGPTLMKMLTGKNVNTNAYIGSIYHGVSAATTPKDIETAFQLIYLTYTAPRFDETPFQIGIEKCRSILPNLATNPQFEFQTQMEKTVYGNNPRSVSLSEATINAASLQTQERVYKELFSSLAGGSVVIVGNVNLGTLKKQVEKYIGSIPATGAPTAWVDRNVDPVKGQVVNHFEFPMQAPKATVYQMFNGSLEYNVKNVVALEAASYILDMVYVETIREREGGTYGASAALSVSNAPKQAAKFQIYFDTNLEMAEKLAGITKEELFRLGNEGPTDVMFSQAIENLKKNIPETKIENNYWRNLILRYASFGVDSWDKDYEEAVNTLTKEDIKAAVSKVLEQGNFIEIEMRGIQAQ